MKQLTLIRHAKSSWSDPSLGDFDRPLNARGLEDAPRMGAYLKANGCPPVDQIVSSPALRARTTAKLIAEKLGMTNESIMLEPCIYEATLHRLFKLIGALDDAHPHVMLFGHNPGFAQLAYGLDPCFTGDGDKFPTCGVAQMKLAIDRWSEVEEACASECRFVYPKGL